MPIAGVLLAAGRGKRFQASGGQDKLLHVLHGGDCVAAASARRLLQAVPTVHAVIRPDAGPLGDILESLGCRITVCAEADTGMAASLVAGLQATLDADGWLISLADMPYVKVETMQALAHTLSCGADIVQPFLRGVGGNPVGFSRRHLAQLLALKGDRGARALLEEHAVTGVDVDDDSIFHDIDTLEDLYK
jgi:molybdenum cofactor cytidylyltransferase